MSQAPACKHGDHSSDLRAHMQSEAVVHICNSSAPWKDGRLRQENPWKFPRPAGLLHTCSNKEEEEGHWTSSCAVSIFMSIKVHTYHTKKGKKK